MKIILLKSIHTDEIIEVTGTTYISIINFQAPVEDFKELDSILMNEEDEPIVGKVYYDWVSLKKKYPKFAEAIDILSSNRFSTVLEFDCKNDREELVRRSVLFQMKSWEEYA